LYKTVQEYNRKDSLRPYLYNPVMPVADSHEVTLTQTCTSIKDSGGYSRNTYQSPGSIKYFISILCLS